MTHIAFICTTKFLFEFFFLYFKNINFVKRFSIRLDDRVIIDN